MPAHEPDQSLALLGIDRDPGHMQRSVDRVARRETAPVSRRRLHWISCASHGKIYAESS